MKTIVCLILTALLVIFTFTPTTFAQDYTKWHLPEGAKARLEISRLHQKRSNNEDNSMFDSNNSFSDILPLLKIIQSGIYLKARKPVLVREI